MVIRGLWFAVLCYTAFAGPWVFALLVGLAYCARYAGPEVIAVALLVDVGYGYHHTLLPWHTLGTIGCLLLSRWLHPRLLWTHARV